MMWSPTPACGACGRAIPDSVIFIISIPSPLTGKQLNQYVVGLAVLDGIVHRLLRDVIQMRRHGRIVNQYRVFALEATGKSEQVFDLTGIEPQSADIKP